MAEGEPRSRSETAKDIWRLAGGDDLGNGEAILDESADRARAEAIKSKEQKKQGRRLVNAALALGLSLTVLAGASAARKGAEGVNENAQPPVEPTPIASVSGGETDPGGVNLDAEAQTLETAHEESVQQDIVEQLGLEFSPHAFAPELADKNGDALIPTKAEQLFNLNNAEGCFGDPDKNNQVSVAANRDIYSYLYGISGPEEASPEQMKGAMIYLAERQSTVAAAILVDNKVDGFADLDYNAAAEKLNGMGNTEKQAMAEKVAALIANPDTRVRVIDLEGKQYHDSGNIETSDDKLEWIMGADERTGKHGAKAVEISYMFLDTETSNYYHVTETWKAGCANLLEIKILDEKSGVEFHFVNEDVPDEPGPDQPGPDQPGPDQPGPGPDQPGPGPDQPGPGPDQPGPGPDQPGPGPDQPGPDEHKTDPTTAAVGDHHQILGVTNGEAPEVAPTAPKAAESEPGQVVDIDEDGLGGQQAIGETPTNQASIDNGDTNFKPESGSDGIVNSEEAERAEAERQRQVDEANKRAADLAKQMAESGSYEYETPAEARAVTENNDNATPPSNPGEATPSQAQSDAAAELNAFLNGTNGESDTTVTSEPGN